MKAKKQIELKAWADAVITRGDICHVFKADVYGDGIGMGYIGTCEIVRDKYIFQGKKLGTPEELCEAFKEYGKTLPFPIALFDQSILQTYQLNGIFDYYLTKRLGFTLMRTNRNYVLPNKESTYSKRIGETEMEINIHTDDNNVRMVYNCQGYGIKSAPIKDYQQGINLIDAYILGMIG